jgi:hypothetical protein
VTAPGGTFTITLQDSQVVAGQPYILEAVKGLKKGGNPDRAGASLARLRTFVVKNGGAWSSFTEGSIVISRSTTALAAIAGLKGLSQAEQIALSVTQSAEVGTAGSSPTPATPDTFTSQAGSSITKQEFHTVWDLVDKSLAADLDPVRSIGYNIRAGAQRFFAIGRAPLVTDVSNQNLAAGATTGLLAVTYGHLTHAGLTFTVL